MTSFGDVIRHISAWKGIYCCACYDVINKWKDSKISLNCVTKCTRLYCLQNALGKFVVELKLLWTYVTTLDAWILYDIAGGLWTDIHYIIRDLVQFQNVINASLNTNYLFNFNILRIKSKLNKGTDERLNHVPFREHLVSHFNTTFLGESWVWQFPCNLRTWLLHV